LSTVVSDKLALKSKAFEIFLTDSNGKKCKFCSKSLNRSMDRTVHEESVHLKIQHYCDYENCKTSCSTEKALSEHEKKIHVKKIHVKKPVMNVERTFMLWEILVVIGIGCVYAESKLLISMGSTIIRNSIVRWEKSSQKHWRALSLMENHDLTFWRQEKL